MKRVVEKQELFNELLDPFFRNSPSVKESSEIFHPFHSSYQQGWLWVCFRISFTPSSHHHFIMESTAKSRVSYVVPTATQPLFACASCARRKNILELSIPVSCLLIYSYYFNKSFYGWAGEKNPSFSIRTWSPFFSPLESSGRPLRMNELAKTSYNNSKPPSSDRMKRTKSLRQQGQIPVGGQRS